MVSDVSKIAVAIFVTVVAMITNVTIDLRLPLLPSIPPLQIS